MKPSRRWQTWVWLALVVAAAGWMTYEHWEHATWVARLSAQGGTAPAIDAQSPTGYVLGQRQLLAAHERGETYRWIARTQTLVATGARTARTYVADNVPVGRPELASTLYTGCLAAIAEGAHAFSDGPIGLVVERLPFWEALLTQIVALLAIVLFLARRYGLAAAAIAAVFFALFPLIQGQFLPGVLGPRTWALLLAAYVLARHLGARRSDPSGFCVRDAVAAALALWLDPAIGFSSVVISGAVGVGLILSRGETRPFRRWALVGASLTTLAWLVDNPLWSPVAGELRYVHPLYALAWLGVGLVLEGWQGLRQPNYPRWSSLLALALGVPLIASLAGTQIMLGYKGWLYPGAAMERLTSLDETVLYPDLLAWIRHATTGECILLIAPTAVAVFGLVLSFRRNRDTPRSTLVTNAIVLLGTAALAAREIRWLVVVSLLALPVIALALTGLGPAIRRGAAVMAAGFFVGLMAWHRTLPPELRRPTESTAAAPADINALIYRHFAHWLATHNPGHKINALAPPELSDSLIFHGGSHVLMSTAWQSYPGQVAASRFLSALESTEAEAVLQSREITHVILPSWDEVLPLLVHEPPEQDKSTLYSRLQRWVFPPYLRPIPYHFPPVPGYADQKLVVFKVVPEQDEALSLARLAEYFVEMDRDEPATLVAKVLAESYPDDPNAAIARATVAAYHHDAAVLDRELTRLAADVGAGRVPSSWDRRVQRAVVFALGHQRDLVHSEVAQCVAETSDENLLSLTPLQAYRLVVLAQGNHVAFANPAMARLAASLGAEYGNPLRVAAPP